MVSGGTPRAERPLPQTSGVFLKSPPESIDMSSPEGYSTMAASEGNLERKTGRSLTLGQGRTRRGKGAHLGRSLQADGTKVKSPNDRQRCESNR